MFAGVFLCVSCSGSCVEFQDWCLKTLWMLVFSMSPTPLNFPKTYTSSFNLVFSLGIKFVLNSCRVLFVQHDASAHVVFWISVVVSLFGCWGRITWPCFFKSVKKRCLDVLLEGFSQSSLYARFTFTYIVNYLI